MEDRGPVDARASCESWGQGSLSGRGGEETGAVYDGVEEGA